MSAARFLPMQPVQFWPYQQVLADGLIPPHAPCPAPAAIVKLKNGDRYKLLFDLYRQGKKDEAVSATWDRYKRQKVSVGLRC